MSELNVSISFNKFLQKFTPETHWKKLVLLTRSRGKPVQEGGKVESGYSYRLGMTILKENSGYSVITRTILDGVDTFNSEAIFTKEKEYCKGIVNVFTGYLPDVGGEYHNQIFEEYLEEEEKLEWDKVE